MKGRKPIPPELRGGEAAVPIAFDSLPPCPSWLDPDAHVMWHRLAPELCARGLLSSTLLEPFAGYCQCWAQWKHATETIRREGLTCITGQGMTRIHPAVSHATEMAKQVRAYAAEFGLTPASRARAGAPVQSDADAQIDMFLDNLETREG